jgi:hypothetical protein
MYRNGWHKDADKNMESFIILQCVAAAKRASELGVTGPAPTLVPELGIQLRPDPNVMVVTMLLKMLWHATGTAATDPAWNREWTSRERRELGRSACESFLLQSRGAKNVLVPPQSDSTD